MQIVQSYQSLEMCWATTNSNAALHTQLICSDDIYLHPIWVPRVHQCQIENHIPILSHLTKDCDRVMKQGVEKGHLLVSQSAVSRMKGPRETEHAPQRQSWSSTTTLQWTDIESIIFCAHFRSQDIPSLYRTILCLSSEASNALSHPWCLCSGVQDEDST